MHQAGPESKEEVTLLSGMVTFLLAQKTGALYFGHTTNTPWTHTLALH